MIEIIYIEDSIAQHPRTIDILKRFPQATPIPCANYKEVFNPAGQNFRLQKKKPALILAEKKGNRALPIPETYGIGGKYNFYFSHMLNCLYDCRYCFLQGMYPSAHYVLFVNYEDFLADIQSKTRQEPTEPTWFFSGYDCDSLALENISTFTDFFLPFFQKNTNARLELRTKSVNITPLLKHTPSENIVTAFSFTPKEISIQLETLFERTKFAFSKNNFQEISSILDSKQVLLESVSEKIDNQISRTKSEESSPKNTTLYFSLLTETKDLIKANMAMLELYNEQYDSNIEPPTMSE